jgi:hypothetical protein
MKIEGLEIHPKLENKLEIIIEGLEAHLVNEFYPFDSHDIREMLIKYCLRKAKTNAQKIINETRRGDI